MVREGMGGTTTMTASKRKAPPAGAVHPTIPTDLLRTFVAVYELGSFTKAAHLLEISQPAVSAQMRKLEGIIGADLTEKKASGVHLTGLGSEVLKSARQLLSVNDRMVAQFGNIAGQEVIRFGIPNAFAGNLLPPIVAELRTRNQNAKLQICCDGSRGLMRSIRCGYLDIAFAFGETDNVVDAVRSWPEELVWARSPTLQVSRDKPLPLISSPNQFIADRCATEALDHVGQPYQIVFSAFDVGARCAGAVSGLGYLVAPRRLIPSSLTIEEPGVLPPLRPITIGIFTSGMLDTVTEEGLVSALENILRSRRSHAATA
jgi:DNA-binding transcriptional LysR family regulator